MRKQSKRRIRDASEPGLTRLFCTPEISIAERMAVTALVSGFATYDNSYRVLADCHGLLSIECKRKRDEAMNPILAAGYVALLNIHDRARETRRYGATGEEVAALRAMVDYAEDHWKRQPFLRMQEAIVLLRQVREKQIKEMKK